MADVIRILLLIAGGTALGLFYYGGLWYTVRRLPGARNPALLTLGSLATRLAVCLPCFYLAARGGQWLRLLVFAAAFLAARQALTLYLGPGSRAAAARTVSEA
ncbi:MAG: ATP synthase subunit I [Gaiellales bacterium]|nr:MAG: ATP synthase subunit I [Gaiellales bacterium]